MKRLTLKRVSSSPFVTFGVLLDAISGIPLMVTLEKPWLNNEDYVSCVPCGTYICKPYNSDRHKDVYQITNVPGRTKVLFHIGNHVDDTEGCVLPGIKYGSLGGLPAVLESRDAMNYLRKIVGKNKFILEIT